MTRMMAAPADALPRPSSPAVPVLAVFATGLVLAGIAAAVHLDAAAVAIGVVAVLGTAGMTVLQLRSRGRLRLVDLYLMHLSSLLGWAAPARSHVVASRWAGGWIGSPRRIRISYNPLADETLMEISAEARRQAERLFSSAYKVGRSRPKRAWFELVQHSPADSTVQDQQTERVGTIVAKTFGPGAGVSTKFDKGELREFTVRYEVTPRLSSSALRARIESSMSAVLNGRWRAFWDLQGDRVRFEVRPDLSNLILNPNKAPDDIDPLATYDHLEVPIGLDEDGHVISWKPKRDPHGLVTGKTGKGKTVVLLGIIMYLAAHGWKVWGIDGKRIELLGLREWPNVELIAGRIDHQARVAHEMFTMMQQRFEDYEAGTVKLEDFEPVLFVIDEYKTFRNAVTRWFRSVKPKGPGSQAPVLEEISDFVSLARKVRMHLVIGLQRPDAEFLTGDMRDNFNFRVSLGRLSPEGAKMMWDSFSTGVAIPPFAIGRGIAHNAMGQPVEIQTYWTPDPYQTDPDHPELWVSPNDLELVENLVPSSRRNELKEILEPENWRDLDDPKSTKEDPDYLDYMATRIVPVSEASRILRQVAAIDVDHSPIVARVSELERIQIEEAEPEDSDEDLFAGYSEPDSLLLAELVDDDGELAHEGLLALVDADNDTWGLVDFAELDETDNGYVSLNYRDFETGEPGQLSLPEHEPLVVRRPGA